MHGEEPGLPPSTGGRLRGHPRRLDQDVRSVLIRLERHVEDELQAQLHRIERKLDELAPSLRDLADGPGGGLNSLKPTRRVVSPRHNSLEERANSMDSRERCRTAAGQDAGLELPGFGVRKVE